MTKAEAVAQLKQLLGFRTDLATQAPLALAQAQDKLEQEWRRPDIYPFFLKTELSDTATVASEPRVALPSDWLADWEDSGLWITNSDSEEILLCKNDFDILRKLYVNEDPTLPVAYCIDGIYYRLFPTPDAAYTLKQIYYQQDSSITSLSDGDENLWLKYAPWALIGRAALILAAGGVNKTRDMAAALMQDSIDSVIAKSIWMQETSRRPAMGETF